MTDREAMIKELKKKYPHWNIDTMKNWGENQLKIIYKKHVSSKKKKKLTNLTIEQMRAKILDLDPSAEVSVVMGMELEDVTNKFVELRQNFINSLVASYQ